MQKAIQVLLNLEHRGATGSEANSGDGAGMLLQVPHDLLVDCCEGKALYSQELVSTAWEWFFFLPIRKAGSSASGLLKGSLHEEGQQVLGWRTVPTDNSLLGRTARLSQPVIRQLFISRSRDFEDDSAFERKLYVIRRRASRAVRSSAIPQCSTFYIASLSHKTIIYKGMLTAGQLHTFYPDLTEKRLSSALALVHSRFSTNTFPSWARAHPYRYVAHNGEINTLRGNINWMRARETKV